MSRGMRGWLSTATAVGLLHIFGLDSPFLKQLVFSVAIATTAHPGTLRTGLVEYGFTVLQYVAPGLALFYLLRTVLSSSTASAGTGNTTVLLFPCKTTHARLFPKKHSFEYSYLVVGIPVGWEGLAGGMVSSSSSSNKEPWYSWNRKGWYHVNPADYLYRGDGHLGLRGKLDTYLISQGADPAKYPHAYLVTAARFLGYHFNPVSFWYLYSEDMSLAAMILEVNNTFDERRMYFLTPAKSDDDALEGAEPICATNGEMSKKKPAFKQQWPKDFHVSPFNSRKGSYSLLASDPLSALPEGKSLIDSTITLRSGKGHGKIVARLFSDGEGVDPTTMSVLQKVKFLLSWWWVGFITFPRIVREAARLWFQKSLHVWYRPEPLKESMGRHADGAERALEMMFRKYLRYLTEQCQAAIAVKYIPSGISSSEADLMLSPLATAGAGDTQEIEFKVLTPAFYTRFVFYAHDLEALFSEMQESCTTWISRPDLLPKLLFKKPTPPTEAQGPLDYIFFEAIRRLRRRPEAIVRPLTSSHVPTPSSGKDTKPTTSVVDIREFRISSMDAFILSETEPQLRRQYRSLVLRLFIADRLAFGSLLFVDAVFALFKTWLAWTLASAWQDQGQIIGGLLGAVAYGML
ncbi:hypothetical protein BD289DRAFT_388706 [Coniella lustricola]|uniref:DUF1365-domain-containing protein n=1 Tax=Coniella lustricola TaxID=2025994 RepID=A0A2T3A9R5_9PEZI|nr:hypothetical protein BD289DRAFT_388706 [Coniella lustricola]